MKNTSPSSTSYVVGDPLAPRLQARKIFEALGSHAVEYVVVGGLAASVYGSGRITYDVDVVPDWTKDNLQRLADALLSISAKLRIAGTKEAVDFPLDAESLGQFEVSTWRTEFGDLDVISGTPTSVRGVLATYDQLLKRAHQRSAFGLSIAVADLDDIIESKLALSREPDLAALPELHRLREQRDRDI